MRRPGQIVVATSLVFATMAVLVIESGLAFAEEASAGMNLISDDGIGQPIGRVSVSDAGQGGQGVQLVFDLTDLAPGRHGFHLHENGECGPAERDGKMVAGGAAGSHYDPQSTTSHKGPEGQGHLGDLPALEVSAEGIAKGQTQAPRLKVSDMRGKALIIHEGGDTYSDEPKDGGGKERVACGVVR
jgi:Cu-Zn family superoxide dismutase